MRALQGYPTSVGNKRFSVFPHAGPASYTQVTTGPVAGGDTVSAVEAGIKSFDQLIGGISDSGLYRVEAIPSAGHPSGSTSNPTQAPTGAPMTTYTLRWTVVATGAEVAAAVNLSAQIVRLTGFGL